MDTVNLEAILNIYKRILGAKGVRDINQDNISMLERVTGAINFTKHIGFLLNIICYIENRKNTIEEDMENNLYKQRCDEVKSENDRLISLNNELEEKLKSRDSLIETYNKCYVQQAKLKNGEKIARRNDVTAEDVIKFKQEGLTIGQIAKKLGVSKSTINRRSKEGENKMDKQI
ncbi:helix-turn-helix domain-containing protein [Clostridium sp. CX1]|uniref:helix-turn-helix domain-containing protein n=1 Tax=Clostridium sp. CX1 TaxID=2978346 RepID=UPI0021C22BF9|nr:helix-turn-helix domain-containing protein [Clostridium sp. CX1]MCT8974984.1 helix-turn-helix domain-containing protein [Clostridium sp. CX1]